MSILICVLYITILPGPAPVQADEYLRVAGLIDLRTDFSDGTHTLDYIIRLARKRGFKALVITDHDRKVLVYGLRPFQNVLKKRVETPSIRTAGLENYLNTIHSLSKKHPETILIPGTESAPFYYWRGSYFRKNLTVCDWEKHLIIVGMENPEDYEDLPVLHNGYSTKYLSSRISVVFFLFLIPLGAGLYLITKQGILRYSGIVLSLLGLLLLINNHPFQSSPFDQYHGYQGIAPYQLVIDYVNSRGGMVFWNHPETQSGQGKLDMIFKDTPPYPQVLRESRNYTGFAALYGAPSTIIEPGNEWDKILKEYCSGQRTKPAWGISTANFHQEGAAGEKLGNFPTIFLVEALTEEAVLDALKKGRMFAYRGDIALPRVVLEEFSVSDSQGGSSATMGEDITLEGKPEIKIHVTISRPEKGHRVEVRLIRGGEILETFSGETPLTIQYSDSRLEASRKTFYRLDVRDKKDRIIISNPIFVSFSPSG